MTVIVEHKTPTMLTGRALKVTVLLSPAELLTYPLPEQQVRVKLRTKVAERTVTADIAAKSLRRAQATIRESGAENVVCILQGKLGAHDEVLEAGLAAQVKVSKPTAEAK